MILTFLAGRNLSKLMCSQVQGFHGGNRLKTRKAAGAFARGQVKKHVRGNGRQRSVKNDDLRAPFKYRRKEL